MSVEMPKQFRTGTKPWRCEVWTSVVFHQLILPTIDFLLYLSKTIPTLFEDKDAEKKVIDFRKKLKVKRKS